MNKLKSFFLKEIQEPRYGLGPYPDLISQITLNNNNKSSIYDVEAFISIRFCHQNKMTGFPGGTVVESLPANAGDTGSSPGLGRSHMPRSD